MSTRRVRGIRAEQRPEKRDHLVLAYHTAHGGRHVVLRGRDEHKDSLVVVLDQADRTYTLSESTLSAGEYQAILLFPGWRPTLALAHEFSYV